MVAAGQAGRQRGSPTALRGASWGRLLLAARTHGPVAALLCMFAHGRHLIRARRCEVRVAPPPLALHADRTVPSNPEGACVVVAPSPSVDQQSTAAVPAGRSVAKRLPRRSQTAGQREAKVPLADRTNRRRPPKWHRQWRIPPSHRALRARDDLARVDVDAIVARLAHARVQLPHERRGACEEKQEVRACCVTDRVGVLFADVSTMVKR